MGKRTLTVRYDAVGDILMVDLVPRHANQETDLMEDGYVLVRFNAATGRAESFDVLNFLREVEMGTDISLPLDAVLEPVPGS